MSKYLIINYLHKYFKKDSMIGMICLNTYSKKVLYKDQYFKL